MLPPYHTEEIARALQDRLASAGVATSQVAVTADDRGRRWLLSARWAGGQSSASYPFAASEGIHTPAELASWFVRDAGLR